MTIDPIISLVLIVIGACLFYGPWQWIMTDVARQSFFNARDSIFDLAMEGKLSFDSEEYIIIRRSLEHTIRFAHRVSLPRFVVLSAALTVWATEEPISDLRSTIAKIHDPDTRKRVDRLVNEAYRKLVISMTAKSMIGLLLIALATITVPVAQCVRPLVSVLNKLKSVLLIKADYLQIEAEAARVHVGRGR